MLMSLNSWLTDILDNIRLLLPPHTLQQSQLEKLRRSLQWVNEQHKKMKATVDEKRPCDTTYQKKA